MRNLTKLLVLTVALLVASISSSSASPTITTFDGDVLKQNGTAATQAGSHPYSASTSIDFATVPGPNLFSFLPDLLYPEASVKDMTVDLPAGFVGNPLAAPTCTQDQISRTVTGEDCPTSSIVGRVQIYGADRAIFGEYNVYNMVPPLGQPAQFGFNVIGSVVFLNPRLNPANGYAITVDVRNLPQAIPVTRTVLTLWGVPADPGHDVDRGGPSQAPQLPFLTNPVACTPLGVGLPVDLRTTSWQHPDSVSAARFLTHLPAPDQETQQGPDGCERLDFDPEVAITVPNRALDSPTGLSVGLDFAQEGLVNPSGVASSYLRDAQVTLPEGLTINPSAAGGLSACSDAELGLGSVAPLTCPESSKIGTVTAATPLLAEGLTGGVYIRSQNSSDPESGEMFRVALVLQNTVRGVLVKLPGAVRVDKDTGRIVATFANNPQLPVSHIDLDLKSGPRAALATPPTCGEKAIGSALSSWSGSAVSRTSSFEVLCTPGLGGFTPSFSAGTRTPAAGVFSPFGLSLSKPDGDAAVSGLSLSLPTGLLASLRGNLGKQVGTVTAFAGPGSSPYPLPGRVYLEGRYVDAPFSLRVVVPAKAGPFDLGDVTVRQKIYVDPIDAHVTVVSDPLPTIVNGVPVRLQRLDVSVDKDRFTLNPTSCAPRVISGTLASASGQSAAVSSRFQAGDCSLLTLKPTLALSLSGKGQTTDGKHPAVTANLTQPFGAQANLKKVRVALPLSLALDPDNANGLCEFVDGSKIEPTCPKASIVGSATAVTPILDEPLSGPVYFVKNIRRDAKSGREIRTLPKLVIPLVGQNGVKLTLTGTSDVVDDQLVTTFDNVPDAPVSSFKLNINGGKGGILTVSGADICKATQIADQQIDGQNSKNADADVYIQTPSCATKIISKTVGKTTVKVKIGGLGAGKVTVTGRGIKKTTKTIAKSTVATITAKRTKGKPGAFKVKFTKAKTAATTATR